ncbi:hypothetical protein DFH07DRAFT_171876 [Mycena maculata]|uniref:Uncharacterized protein n=1 Tax=Mycena maculata TaxID=230809 RepID=A0AAD7NS90_9AGAR|nr:hypothetical protein DFH07DRAFT_171876 [Mycena maculata]
MASSATAAQIAGEGLSLIYDVVGMVVQAFFYGVYTVVIVLSTRTLLKRGLKTRANKVMFIFTMFMYFLSSAYWVYSIADVVDRIQDYVDDVQNPLNYTANHDSVTKWSPLFNALLLINYTLSDSVVVWRAWVLSLRSHRKYLCITIGFLILTAIAVIAIIIFRIIALMVAPYTQLPSGSYLTQGINILQTAVMVLSLLSNLSATAVVGATAWHHRKAIQAAFADNKKYTKADQILSLVVESGALYCISGLTVLVCSLIRLPHGTLGDLYTPVNVQIAGAYPAMVLLLVSLQRSFNETTFLNTFEASVPSRPMQFAGAGSNPQSHSAVSIQFARNPNFSRTELGSQPDAIMGSDTDHIAYDNLGEKIKGRP